MVLRPLIVVVNSMSNGLLRISGVESGHGSGEHDARELKAIIGAAAMAGNISTRQRLFAENIIDLVELEVRHIMLPRTQVAYLDSNDPVAKSLARIRSEGHSRWPLANGDLDDVVGIVLARDVLEQLIDELPLNLEEISRPPHFVPDTQPLARFIVESQQTGHQGALVVDEHGTVVGMAFLEDALEEIVGPLHDERDAIESIVDQGDEGVIEMRGSLDLPEASHLLGVEFGDAHDTIGGVLIAKLGRLPRKGDVVTLEGYDALVVRTGRGRSIHTVRFTPTQTEDDD
jgi:CBS domain containing-hemolysin-like protein